MNLLTVTISTYFERTLLITVTIVDLLGLIQLSLLDSVQVEEVLTY